MLRIIEDGAGGLYLTGSTATAAEIVGYGDLQYSSSAGVAELVTAYWEGIDGWEHDQDNDLDAEPEGVEVASYDGTDLILHVERMGYAGRQYLLGDGAESLRRR